MSEFVRWLRSSRGACPRSAMPLIAIAALAGVCVFQRPTVSQAESAAPLSGASFTSPVAIREHAGWDGDCRAIASPPLFLVSPPRHGKVCALAQQINITSMYAGTESQCVGRFVEGVKLIYQPDPSFTGDDAMVYAVRYPSNLRTISVTVARRGEATARANVADTEIYLSAAASRQMQSLPACPQFVF